MFSIKIPPVSCEQYATYLSQVHHAKRYLWYKAPDKYRLSKDKHDSEVKLQGFTCLTYQQMMILGDQLKNSLIVRSDIQDVVACIKKMHLQKKQHADDAEKNTYTIALFISRIWEYTRNFFQGYGYKSTLNLGEELIQWLEAHAKPLPIPNEESQSKKISEKKAEIKQQPNFAECFNKNYEIILTDKCPKIKRKIILQDLKFASDVEAQKKEPSLYAKNPAISIEGLIRVITKTLEGEVDLTLPASQAVIRLVMINCTHNLTYSLVNWLKEQPTFNVTALKNILSSFIERPDQNNPLFLESLQVLMVHYMKRQWNKILDETQNPIMPLDNPQVVSICSLLLKCPHNDNRKVCEFIEWAWKDPAFNENMCKSWMLVFMEKESQHKEINNMHYPVLNNLLAHLKTSQPAMLKKLLMDDSIATYINKKLNQV